MSGMINFEAGPFVHALEGKYERPDIGGGEKPVLEGSIYILGTHQRGNSTHGE